jgi:hypothetical protein
VADDNSPDGASAMVKNFYVQSDKIKILQRSEKGSLRQICVEGFRYMLSQNLFMSGTSN